MSNLILNTSNPTARDGAIALGLAMRLVLDTIDEDPALPDSPRLAAARVHVASWVAQCKEAEACFDVVDRMTLVKNVLEFLTATLHRGTP